MRDAPTRQTSAERLATVLFVVFALLALPQSATAAQQLLVGNGTPASCTQAALQDALEIAGALGGGTIQFNCGPGAVVIALTEAVTVIDGVPGRVRSVAVVVPNNTTIDGDGVITLDGQFGATLVFVDRDTTAALRGLNITCSSDCLAALNRGTLTVGHSTFSNTTLGAILNVGTLKVGGSTFSNNDNGPCCTIGGAIVNSGDAIVANSTFTGNTAGRGGAIGNGGTLTVKHSVFSDNAGFPSSPGELDGGGTIWNGGTLAVENSEISGSTPGAILNRGTATIHGSKLSGNSNPYFRPGGAIVNFDALTIKNSQISDNSALSGGGIYNAGALSALTIDHSEIFGNSAYDTRPDFFGGGGIFNGLGTLTIKNSQISGNNAGTFGGGIVNFGVLSITNSTISQNIAAIDGGGIYTYTFGRGTVELERTAVTGNTPNDIIP
jgi:hypothetical protein